MLRSFFRFLKQISRRLYVRVVLIGALSVFSVFAAAILSPILPERLGETVGAGALDTILSVIANSMLAVTIFSLTMMTGAFQNAAAQWTPRSHMVLREDTVTHSVLATFVGAYLFALIAIILRATEFIGEKEAVVLFGVTLGVVIAIIVSIIRWIVHLEELGSLLNVIRSVEQRTLAAAESHGRDPFLGGRPLIDLSQVPDGAAPLTAARDGYIQQLFEDALQAAAEHDDLQIYLTRAVGSYVYAGETIALISGCDGSDSLPRTISEAILIDDVRSFDQDPRYGIAILGEIADRALSPGVNDPSTAIDVLLRLGGIVTRVAPTTGEPPESPRCDRVWIPPLDPERLFLDSFDPVSRDAGAMVEVHVALMTALAQIARQSAPELSREALLAARRCERRARAAISDPDDLRRLQAAVAALPDDPKTQG